MSESIRGDVIAEIEDFYAECSRLTPYSATINANYGTVRARDCYYAERLDLFERISVKKRRYQSHNTPLAEFDFIYNRPGTRKDLAYVIAPDTRVPNYTTSFEDCLELAIKIGLSSLPVPSTHGRWGLDEITGYIIEQCDDYIARRVT